MTINSSAPQQTPQAFVPAAITKLDDTGLSSLWLQDLTLKILYYQGNLSLIHI